MQTNYEVALSGVRFHARVGILPHERELPQPIELDVRVWPDAPAAAGGAEGGAPLDYRRLHDLIDAVLSEGPIDYLEGLALAVAERAIALGSVRRVRVAARKPHVILPGPVRHAEVVVEVARDA
ncbi:MAG: dihydroneopterin aldolase [Gemmatimonadaceae bacterium]